MIRCLIVSDLDVDTSHVLWRWGGPAAMTPGSLQSVVRTRVATADGEWVAVEIVSARGGCASLCMVNDRFDAIVVVCNAWSTSSISGVSMRWLPQLRTSCSGVRDGRVVVARLAATRAPASSSVLSQLMVHHKGID